MSTLLNLPRALLITRREVVTTVFTRSFLLGNLLLPLVFVLMPVVMAGLFALPSLLGAGTSPWDLGGDDEHQSLAERVMEASGLDAPWALADQTGHLGAPLGEKLGFGVEVVQVTEAAQLEALDARVRSGELGGWLHLDARTLESGWMAWHAPASDLKRHVLPLVQEVVRWEVVALELGPGGSDRVVALRQGDIEQVKVALDDDDPMADRLLAMLGGKAAGLLAFPMMMGLVFVPMLGAGRVVKERQQGLVELLTCVASPAEVVVGKTLAALTIATCALTLWLAVPSAIGLVGLATAVPAGTLAPGLAKLATVLSPASVLVWGVLFATSAFGLLLVTVAAAVVGSDQTKGVGMLGMLPMFALYPMMGLIPALEDAPHTALAQAMAFVPVLGAPVMWIRWSAGAGSLLLPASIALSLTVCVLVAGAVVWIGRAAMVLGGWPRSLADLRTAWITA